MDPNDADILLAGACECYFMQQTLHMYDYVEELEVGDYWVIWVGSKCKHKFFSIEGNLIQKRRRQCDRRDRDYSDMATRT